jgi:hypothetical protein
MRGKRYHEWCNGQSRAPNAPKLANCFESRRNGTPTIADDAELAEHPLEFLRIRRAQRLSSCSCLLFCIETFPWSSSLVAHHWRMSAATLVFKPNPSVSWVTQTGDRARA